MKNDTPTTGTASDPGHWALNSELRDEGGDGSVERAGFRCLFGPGTPLTFAREGETVAITGPSSQVYSAEQGRRVLDHMSETARSFYAFFKVPERLAEKK